MNAESRVTEIWFAGAHSDVGGGYYRDGLSDNALRFMMNEIDRRGIGLKVMAASDIDYKSIYEQSGSRIEYEDVVIEPMQMD